MRKTLALSTIILLLGGCASSSELYWGWHCEGDPRTGEWDCEQRLMRDGQLVDADTVEASLIPDRPSEAQMPQQSLQQVASFDELNNPFSEVPDVSDTAPTGKAQPVVVESWREQLPELNEPDIQPKVESRPRIQLTEPSTPPPDPEPYKPLQLPTAKAPVADPGSVETQSQISLAVTTGFTLQLGALANESAVDEFIAEHGLAESTLRRHLIYRDGRPWFAVTVGHFANRAAAELQGQQLQQQHPAIDYWVRSMASLQKAGTP